MKATLGNFFDCRKLIKGLCFVDFPFTTSLEVLKLRIKLEEQINLLRRIRDILSLYYKMIGYKDNKERKDKVIDSLMEIMNEEYEIDLEKIKIEMKYLKDILISANDIFLLKPFVEFIE